MELVQDTHRLALMNMLLHGIEGGIQFGDTLGDEGTPTAAGHAVLSNPPFGTKKGGGLPTRDDFTYPTSNKQFCFLQHIYRALKPGGRAAVVLPDNVLFESNVGTDIRRDLMDKCNLHTILRLPTGIFYAQGVKTNVLFFTRGKKDKGNTKEVWVYDMRANMPHSASARPSPATTSAPTPPLPSRACRATSLKTCLAPTLAAAPPPWPSVWTPARPAAGAASHASKSRRVATTWTSAGSRTTTPRRPRPSATSPPWWPAWSCVS